MTEVVTGEAVALELRLAKLPSRLLAGLIDAGLQLAVLYGALVVEAAVLFDSDSGVGVALYLFLLVAVLVGYPVAMETLTRGRTLGKMVLGIRVVRDDGGPIAFRQALVRGLFAGLIEKPGLFFGFTMPLAVIAMLVSPKSKRLGDLAAGTVVLQERVPAARPGYLAPMPPPLAVWATMLDLTGLPDGLALSVRQYLSRLPQLTDHARGELGNQLATQVAAVTTPPPPPGTPAWAYLSAVLAERRRRDEIRLAARAPAAFWSPNARPYAHPSPQSSPPRERPPAGPFTLPG